MDAPQHPVQTEREKRQPSSSPPVPIKTYQWEEIRRARQQGGYPWTYLDKAPLEGSEITAEEVLRETAPPRNMSRDASNEPQKILMLDSSPGSNRKLAEGEEDSPLRIPNFSKEISLDSEEDFLEKLTTSDILPDNLRVEEAKVTLSPKGILKRKHPEKPIRLPVDESPRNSKCCHPLVEKIKHIADKTMHHKKEGQKKAKPDEEKLEIIALDCSPGAERRERRKAAELESAHLETQREKTISLVMSSDDLTKNKEHVYEDMIVESGCGQGNDGDTKSGDSKDPSLLIDETMEDEQSVMESVINVKSMYDTAMTTKEKDEDEDEDEDEDKGVVLEVDDVAEATSGKGSPNQTTITDITDEAPEVAPEDKKVHFEVHDHANSTPPKNSSDDEGVEDFWSKIGDHEYEPIGKPTPAGAEVQGAQGPSPPPPPALFVSEPEGLAGKGEDDASSTASYERRMLTEHEDEPATVELDSHSEMESSSIALQKQIEDRYFVNTPTTTESRTECEVSTSQVDSSALENLPLKRENRKRSTVGEEASKLGQKIKSQTGRLKTKLKTIKKPQFNMPERPKFNMPERPKFNFPDRPKFNMPERPKFNMPERPKFNMPERPKFNMPERPKINLPERPKFRMPERPKFLDKTKFTLPDRPKFTMPDKSKFKLPDRPKINFSGFSRNKENAHKEKTEPSSESTSGSKKRMIDFDFKTYPRFSRFKKDKKGGKSSKSERPGTPPPGFATVPRVTKDRQAVMSTSHWEDSSNMSSEEPRHYGLPKDYPTDRDHDFESKLAQVDKDYNLMQEEYQREQLTGVAKVKLDNAELWNAMERSSAQRLEHRGSLPYYLPGNERNNEDIDNTIENGDDESSAASTGHHRRGVLEEIDNDEFFLRQKGISQDNIEVGKYLSDEIRDAFRSPVNALNQLDNATERYDPNHNEEIFDDNIDQTDMNEEVDHSHDIDHDDGYYTFPPVRPSRSRKQRAQESKEQDNDSSFSEVQNIPAPEMFQEPVAAKQEIEKSEAPRKSLFSGGFKEPTEMLQNLNEYENEMDQTRDIPTIPKRRKKAPKDFNYSENGSLFNEPYEDDKWMKPKDQDDRMIDDEIIVHRMEYVMPNIESEMPEESPVAPRRMRSRSRGSRATSACDDDRTSRGADSLTLDSHTHLPTADIEWNLDDMGDDPGYAIVDKVVMLKKSEPPPRPPAPVRRHRSSKSLSADRQFFTVPRALKESTPPQRPSRNYSTLGPSRPPRKKSTTSLTDLKSIPQEASNSDTTQYVEIDDEEFDPHKDLKSGDIISKMKDRPLPPPPRPPRGPKRNKDPLDKRDDDFSVDDISQVPQVNGNEIEDFDDRVPTEDFNDRVSIDDFDYKAPIEDFNERVSNEDFNYKSPIEYYDDRAPIDDYDQDEIIEIEVSTQTDPLPDDFDYTIGMEEPFIVNDKIITTLQNEFQAEDVDPEENSIDAEILSRGLQRFRESSRPSSRTSRPVTPAERPKTPIERPKTPLGRMSPTAILVERRVSSPTRIDERDVMVTEASLTVIPIDDPDSYESKSVSSQKPLHPEPIPKEKPSEMWEALNANTQILPSMEIDNRISECTIEKQTVAEAPQQQAALPRNPELEVVKTQRMQVTDLEVERLNVAELQASRILVSEIEGLSLQVTDINSKSGNLVVRGIELAPGIFDEILQKFAQLTPPSAPVSTQTTSETMSKSEITQETQTDSVPESPQIAPEVPPKPVSTPSPPPPPLANLPEPQTPSNVQQSAPTQEVIFEVGPNVELYGEAPERPPLPHLPPTVFPMAYYPDYSLPPNSFYRLRSPQERPPPDFSEGDPPLPSSRRRKHKREVISSSDEEYRPAPRRAPARSTEPSVAELSSQLFRACQNSVGRTARYILSYISSQFGSGENKKDMQMALVIVLVMIAGLILIGVGDGRTVHHHHWDFFNPTNNQN